MSENLLNDVLANHDVPKRVSSEHDMDKINAQAALMDERELAKMYSPEQIMAMRNDPSRQREAVEAAKGRAKLDLINGKIALYTAGDPPWTGLGNYFDKPLTNSAQVAVEAGINFEMQKIAAHFPVNGEMCVSPNTFLIVRMDTKEEFGAVSDIYNIIQVKDTFKHMDDVLEEFGAHYVSAGSLYGGRKVFICATMPKQAFAVNGNDEYIPFIVASQNNTGLGANHIYASTIRPECNNTFTLSFSQRRKGIAIRHKGSMHEKVAKAQLALKLTTKKVETFKDAINTMNRRQMNIVEFADNVLDLVVRKTEASHMLTKEDMLKGPAVLAAALASTEAEMELYEKKFQKKIDRRLNTLEDILYRYESDRCDSGRGTALACWNAVTESADFNRVGRQLRDEEKRLSKRFESVIDGEADLVKEIAYNLAIAN